MNTILLVDDDPHILRTLEIMLHDDGHEVRTAASGEQALDTLKGSDIAIALIDLQLPGMSGTDLLRCVRHKYPHIETIIITAYGSIETAVEAMKEGAFDYLTKPFSPDQVRHRLKQLVRMRELSAQVSGLQRRLGELPFSSDFLTENPEMLRVLETAKTVALSETTLLLSGESGTGKTLLARLIHDASQRRTFPFVTVDCTCFQDALLESELFGHKKGAFTGAITDKTGKAECADGGTLFLDEVGEVPLHLQGKLMRLVDERKYERIGDTGTRSLDIRIIAATNRDLHDMVRQGAFREDLFFRLSVVDLTLPPLRNRPEDILLLSREFIACCGRAHNKTVSGWDDEVEKLLITYSWPGNIRELSHALERAVLLTKGKTLRIEHFPQRISDVLYSPGKDSSVLTLAQLEENHIRKTVLLNLPVEETAQRLGIDPSTLWRKRRRYGI
jgi:two-component system, NtrC family, response regulator AlgB